MKRKRIGEKMVERGALEPNQLPSLLELQERDAKVNVRSKFGELCVRTGRTAPSEVIEALKEQRDEMLQQTELDDMLILLGFVTTEQLQGVLDSIEGGRLSVEELVLDSGLCTPEQVRLANQLLLLHNNSLVRQQVESTFVPFNVMTLLVAEKIDTALEKDGGCNCSQCWSNIYAVTLNEIPPRYVSDHALILDCLRRYREDYGELVEHTLGKAARIVHSNPKAACRSRFSDDLLTGTEAQNDVHEVVVHVSNRHIHLSEEHVETLFGSNYQLTRFKDLMQPGQYAAYETVKLVGGKGEIDRVRVLGPARNQTQVEISGTDQFILGIKVPVRESGKLKGTPGILIRGPAGEVQLKRGVIRAMRHIHMLPTEAQNMNLKNGEKVCVRLVGDRSMVCEGVLIRATDTSALEMHIDTDEANSAGIPAESRGQILVPAMTV
jgi:putative phosphotransacetylase